MKKPATSTAASTFAFLIGSITAACSGPRFEARPAPEIAPSVTNRGQKIYIGRVFPLGSDSREPTFIYDRHVDEQDGVLVSTHVTREPSGAIALAESATHAADYALKEYILLANQLGQTGSVRVEGNQVTFRLTDGKNQRSRVERDTAPVVVGPTLVGYIFRRLDALRAGEVIGVRMAVLDRLETIGFELQAVDAQPGQTRVRMKPASFAVGLVVDPIHFTFESTSGKLVRLEGRVPPKVVSKDRWHDFDARVEYQFVADVYR